jgi:outer membrane receptor protein involved in Fe transport
VGRVVPSPSGHDPSVRARVVALGVVVLALSPLWAPAALAAVTGKVQGHVVGADHGGPVGFADVLLTPVDTTLKRVGGLTNADGSFLLEALPGHYVLRVRALSYSTLEVNDIVIEAGKLLPFDATLTPEAIQQKEIVVEATARTNTDASILAVRKKAIAVGDAVSAEQVRRSADKDAGEVLRRVTGLTLADGKYVFVRGLGERYSSTEVDGVRIASPEQNRRVVPLDLVPANLLDNIVVQKTYTADRPGEFGGGDVQVHTKDFPGGHTWSLKFAQTANAGVTFHDRVTYPTDANDMWGFGAAGRQLPDPIVAAGTAYPLVPGSPPFGQPVGTLASLARSFANIWSPTTANTLPNGTYAATYGNEFKPLGHDLGVIASGSFTRSFDHRDESQRLFASGPDTSYDYAVSRSTASAKLGALSKLSYRLSPSHSLFLTGLLLNDADDEVRTYEGVDHNRTEATTGTWIQHRDTRLMYVQRGVASATLEGKDQFEHVLGSSVDWKFTRSKARRQQPDTREVIYDRGYYYGPGGELIDYWGLGSLGDRIFGDLHDNGWGTTITTSAPYSAGAAGKGRVSLGYDRQSKQRENGLRRFDLFPSSNADPTAPPETLFSQGAFNGGSGTGYLDEGTLPQDNYHAKSLVTAGFLSIDLPLGRHVRSTLGTRVEHGTQDVRSYDLFRPGVVVAHGAFDNTDWLPSANLTWAMSNEINLRLAASRTLSRPDLNELSPSPSLEYVGGYRQSGNPNLHRALIENYDMRVESFPTANEVFAAGYFYKKLTEPIEQEIQGAVPPLLVPVNSDHGHNQGVELEARSRVGRFLGPLKNLAFTGNATFISSKVVLKEGGGTQLSAHEHPLQGQADYSANVGLGYTTNKQGVDASVQFGAVGKRLRTLGYLTTDTYDQPTSTLDATLNLTPARYLRVKLAARNLLDPAIRQLQGEKEVSSYHVGKAYAIEFNFGQ